MGGGEKEREPSTQLMGRATKRRPEKLNSGRSVKEVKRGLSKFVGGRYKDEQVTGRRSVKSTDNKPQSNMTSGKRKGT